MKRLAVPFEIKAVEGHKITGYGAVTGNVDLGGDIIIPGAFKRTIADHYDNGTRPKMLWQHDPTQPIGVWTSLEEDGNGLSVEGEIADTQLGKDARILAKMKALGGMSIGYSFRSRDDFDFDKQGNRLLKQIDVHEVSLVTFPMNPEAVIQTVKSQFPDPRSMERHLRERGCSQKAAKEVIHLLSSDVMPDEEEPCEADPEVIEAAQKLQTLFIFGQLRRH